MNPPRQARASGSGPAERPGRDPATRRPPRRITPLYLERAALSYLERFASSAENLHRVLTRKVRRRCRLRGEDPAPLLPLVAETVAKALRSGLVDDHRYAKARVASLRRRGGSNRLIAARLASKGVAEEAIAAALRADEMTVRAGAEAELAAAWALARRRRLGPYRAADRAAYREKDLRAMARAGFRFDVARQVVDAEAGGEGCADPPGC